MTKMMETVAPVVGNAYHVVRSANSLGQPILNIRKGDWRAVLITEENLATYADPAYLVQPIKDRHTPRLLAAGWYRFSRSQGECGLEIVAGRLKGLACSKSAFWEKKGVSAGVVCAQHATTYL